MSDRIMSTPEKPPRVANKDARKCVQQRKPFRGNNTFGICVDNRYVVYSYGAHWPLFVYDGGRWFANSDRYSRTVIHSSGVREIMAKPASLELIAATLRRALAPFSPNS